MQGVGRADVHLYFKCLADAVPCERLRALEWKGSAIGFEIYEDKVGACPRITGFELLLKLTAYGRKTRTGPILK